ncbi:hypothetical protein MCOR27_000560 [Pyricularia oryzae]|uniref:Extracellular metalloproteinase n=1 Tax=Pyricularia grisea TaxID=148305 RepID=A0ABQ8NND5_PYRGI|nr:hypothetical protein MCOR01_000645 [Pyricularia oryzae]KAI6299705.1 hypothetical protein MCOR33_004405 [Pyricularia grisea]KAH9428589.1 hypothetical protein MCOR02_011139 [Pyricularia oryzae]KAI6262835.1 hypothetical protein MCOR19_001003 [Pyricularia oryzae]KAI6282733.1 hypothetical protein MCOR26_002692 [Pyricularia oryzae]
MRYSLSLALLGVAAVTVVAHPHTPGRHGVERRAIDLDAFRLQPTAEYIPKEEVPDQSSLAFISNDNYVDVATDLVKSVAPGIEFRVVGDHYVGTNGVAHVNFKQTAHGIDIDNADFNVNVRDGKVFSYGNSFFTGKIPEESPLKKRDFSDPTVALTGATTVLQLPISGEAKAEAKEGTETYTLKGTSGAVSDPEARLVYLVKDDSLALTWRVETDIEDNWLLSYVDANNKEQVHGVVDYVSHASFQVYPWGTNDPLEAGAARVTLTDPWDKASSPFGWLSDGTSTYTTTRGNNAIAQSNPSGGTAYLNNYRPTNANSIFSYPWTPAMSPPSSFVDFSATQLFYTANVFHDLLYKLGFTEAAGNFQVNNNGKGGLGNDQVILNTQDGSGTNNANFATPPDGQNGRMRMYIWTYTTPQRDSSLEAGVVIHEYTHGLSNRLTGGPSNSGCLSALEAGGMGEGWSDFFATAARIKQNDTADTDYPMGEWVAANPKGIRAYPYSTSLTRNPQTYATTNTLSTVHPIGNVWATVLYEVLWALVGKHGLQVSTFPTFDASGVPTSGNFLAQKLVLDGMALQPCNPNFVQARDAIIDADQALTGGANKCELWTAFAKRGLGSGAKYAASKRSVESKTIPAGVC